MANLIIIIKQIGQICKQSQRMPAFEAGFADGGEQAVHLHEKLAKNKNGGYDDEGEINSAVPGSIQRGR